MINRDYMVWLAGIGLSLLLHASLLIQSGAQFGAENASEAKAPLITRLNFYQQPTIQTEKVQKSTPIKPIKKQKKTVAKADIKQQVKEPKVKKVEQQLVQAKPQNQGQLSENKVAMLIKKQEVYMQRLLAHIENRKYYPRSARSRGIEGNVLVSFELMADGGIKSLLVAGGRSILQNATRQAILNSIPLPLPPLELSVPRKIEFSIQYLLQ
jgi:periplasmic protein TonB